MIDFMNQISRINYDDIVYYNNNMRINFQGNSKVHETAKFIVLKNFPLYS